MIRAIVYLLGLCTLAVLVMVGALILCFSNVEWGEYAEKGQHLAKKKIAEAVSSALEEGKKAAEEPPRPERVAERRSPEGVGRRRSHSVRKGETLFSIARRYYDDGWRWKDIASANGIADPSGLRVGTRLVIP